MSVFLPPPDEQVIERNVYLREIWYRFLNDIATALNTAINTPSVPAYTVLTLPDATTAGQMIYVSDESGGAVLAFSDGVNWLRVTDRAIVT